ncbi:helix-turn-helix domain-containing protein [Pedobacter insulae]|uniref:HTH cro/C1-type domain-containing protein n=1 Tax=Pedobacter insulae TaxID=414048 RepID=A0A1I2ZHX1_9SPHI|nr:helix-turn-helix transcriptional regulator [Pedobacter insulae]SFH37245.1 hypothetical protein SAMN04489864_11032 [Pedobacter insulae]
MTLITAQIGSKLRLLRAQNSFSQKHILDETGIPDAIYERMENGRTGYRITHLRKLFMLYEITFTDFFSDIK